MLDSFMQVFCLSVQVLAGHASQVESLAFQPGNDVVAGGAASGTVKLWDLKEGKGGL